MLACLHAGAGVWVHICVCVRVWVCVCNTWDRSPAGVHEYEPQRYLLWPCEIIHPLAHVLTHLVYACHHTVATHSTYEGVGITSTQGAGDDRLGLVLAL